MKYEILFIFLFSCVPTQMWIIPAIFFLVFFMLVLAGWINLDLDDMLDEYEEELALFKDVFTRARKLNTEPLSPYVLYLARIIVVIVMVTVIYFIVTHARVCSITCIAACT